MPATCAVAVCRNCKGKNDLEDQMEEIKYHSFPIKDKSLCKIWIKKCYRDVKVNPATSFICSKHFTENDYIRDLKAELLNLPPKRQLKKTAVPSRNLTSYLEGFVSEYEEKSHKRSERFERRQNRKVVEELLKNSQVKECNLESNPSVSIEISVDSLEIENKELKAKIVMLEKKMYSDNLIFKKLQKENQELKRKNVITSRKFQDLYRLLANYFTKKQIDLIIKEKKPVRNKKWSDE